MHAYMLKLYEKDTLAEVLSRESSKIFRNAYFVKHLRMTAY